LQEVLKRGLVTEPEQWRWSSFRDYRDGQTGKVRVNDTDVMKMRIRKPAAWAPSAPAPCKKPQGAGHPQNN